MTKFAVSTWTYTVPAESQRFLPLEPLGRLEKLDVKLYRDAVCEKLLYVVGESPCVVKLDFLRKFCPFQ